MEIQSWLDKFETEIKLLDRSPKTRSCYMSFLKKFLVYFQSEKDPKHISIEAIKRYLLIISDGHPCQYKQTLATLRFFYGRIVNQPHKLDGLKYRNYHSRLPEIIDKSIILPKIASIKNIRDKAIFSLIYSTGLRVGESCKVRIEDFDRARKILTVREGKGRKDRIVPYPETLGTIINIYYRKHFPSNWLFNGANRSNYISPATIEKKCQDYFGTHPHTLRHCFAVNFLEAGGSIYVLKNLLGHNNIKTTERYLRLTKPMLTMVRNPLDDLGQYDKQPANIYELRRAV